MYYDCFLNIEDVEIFQKDKVDLIVIICKLSLIYFKFIGLVGLFDGVNVLVN